MRQSDLARRPVFTEETDGAPPFVVDIHRFEELIAGRTYLIEVRPVSEARWRAQIARLPGMPTAMMPFYGPTPEGAAQALSRWLALVYNGTKQ